MNLLPTLATSGVGQDLSLRLSEAFAAGADLREVFLDDAARRLLRAVRVPRRFDREICEQLLLPAAEVEQAATFDTLVQVGLVCPVAGRPGWFQLSEQRRPSSSPASGTADDWAPGGERWRELHRALGAWFERSGADGELESIYHLLSSGDASAEDLWSKHYDGARDSFDLARCETLLKLLDECARFVSPALATRGTRERGMLGARAALADDYLRSSRYLEREPLLRAFEALVKDPRHFILQLHAPGGSGKTMFLRWLGPRWCIPRGVPIARVDFDLLDASERRLANAFMLGKLAERLDPQLLGGPMFELLRDLAEDRQRLQRQPAEALGPALFELQKEVCERMARVLVEHCPGVPVLLVFDTMEDAAAKHEVDVKSLVEAVAALRWQVMQLRPEGGPRLMLLLAGRHCLAEQYPQVDSEFGAELVTFELSPFSPTESGHYLERRLHGTGAQPSSEVVAAVVERARGNPFKLSLYADILIGSPGITVDELGKGIDVDMLYLIERVLRRLKDDALHWLLRYGVLARRLTLEFVEQVLLSPVRRSLRGNRRHDDPARDGVAHREWPHLWVAGDGPRLQKVDVVDLWNRLRSYAGASSWIAADAENADAVVIQPIAAQPMRRALLREERRVVAEVHRAAIAYARRNTSGDTALADLTYHEFQLRGAAAAKDWWARIRQRRKTHDWDDGVLAMASVVLSEDLRESDLGRSTEEAPPLVDATTRARALHVVAQVHARRAVHEADPAMQTQHQSLARSYLEQYDDLVAQGTIAPIGGVDDGLLRLEVMGRDATQRSDAMRTLEAALATRLDSTTRGRVLRNLQRFSVDDAERSRRWSRRWGQWTWRSGEAAGYSQYLIDEGRARMRAGRPASALALVIAGREQLRAGGERWRDREAARNGGAAVADEEPPFLAAAGLYEAARRRNAQLHRTSLPAADPTAALRQIRRQTGLMLAAGDVGGALRVLTELLATPSSLTPEPEQSDKWRVEVWRVQALAAREAMDLGLALDALSQAMSLQSQLGDHAGEIATGLEKARIQLLDVGNLQLAAEQMQDSEDAFAAESVELRFEHTLLRAALAAAAGRPGDAVALLARAADLAAGLPDSSAPVAPLLAMAGLAVGSPHDHTRHATELADAWGRFDCVGARLIPSAELARTGALGPLPPALAQRLERLSRVKPLGLPGHRRLCFADRARLTLRRADLLRLIGRGDVAVSELRRLRDLASKCTPGVWMRDLALCCDRLGIAPEEALGAGWLGRLVNTLRRMPFLRGAVYLEAAERAERSGYVKVAQTLLARSGKVWNEEQGPPSIWQLRQLEAQARLSPAGGTTSGSAANRPLDKRIEALRRQLGRPSPADEEVAAPATRLVMDPIKIVHSLVTGLRIFEPDRAVRVAHLENGLSEERRTEPLDPRLAHMLEAMASGRINDAAAPLVAPLLYDRGLGFGRFLADAALPEMLLERLRVAGQKLLRPQELSIEHQRSTMHAMPWELMVPRLQTDPGGDADRPITLHPAVSSFWRAPARFNLTARVAWVQQALGLLADGRLGPRTADAVRDFQSAQKLEPTGRIDPATLTALRAFVGQRAKGVPRVLLITPSRETNIASQRGKDGYGTDLEWTYRSRGLEVHTLREPDTGLLRQLLEEPFGIIHIAAPIAQARSSRELSLQFAATHDTSHTTAFGPSLLARTLRGSPLVIVETPRSSSRDETVRQLLLRNAFSAQMFEQGELQSVIALGLAPPEVEQFQSDLLVSGLAEQRPAADLVQQLRQTPLPDRTRDDLIEQLCTAGIALFSRDPAVVALRGGPS